MKNIENVKKDTIVFEVIGCINVMIYCIVTLKGKPRKTRDKILEYQLLLMAHYCSAFDTYIVLNNLPIRRKIVNVIRKAKGFFSSKMFNGFVEISENNAVAQYIFFRCGMTHINSSLRKMATTYALQKELF